MTLKVKVATQICLRLNISQTVRDNGLVSMEHLEETTYRGKNDHVTDDVMLPRKVKTVTQIHLSFNISKSFGDRVSVPMKHL